MHAVTRQPRRIAALSVGCGLLAVGLATRWEARAALRSVAVSRQYIFGVTNKAYSVPLWRTAIRFSSSLTSIFAPSSLPSSNMANLTPPQPPPVWTHTPEDVLRLTKEAIEKDREVQDRVGKLPASECNFETVSATPIYVTATFPHIT
jgi:metallopeptidase MepB